MRLFLILLLFCSPLSAEEWFDFFPNRSPYSNPASASSYSWHKLSRMELSMSGGYVSGIHGNSHRKIFELRKDLIIVRKNQKGKFYHPSRGMAAAHDFVAAISLLDRFHGMENGKGHGLYGGVGAGFTATMRGLFLPRDAVSLSFGYFGLGAWQPWLDHDNYNFNVRLADHWGAEWLSDLKDMSLYFGPVHPKSNEAIEFAHEVEGLGYPHPIAMMIGWLAEEAGYDFSSQGPSRALLIESLFHNLKGDAPSLESGADPLKDNGSGLFSRGILWQEFGASYSAGITQWFNVGMTLKYMRAWRMSSFSQMDDIGIDDFDLTKAKDLRHGFGVDLGVTFMPTDGIAFGISARNLSFPTFSWENLDVQFLPQVRASFEWRAAVDVPLWIRSELDLNRVESTLLRGLHHQKFRFGVAFSPDQELWGFTIGLGTSKNIGDSNEPWLLEGHLGGRVWKIGLDVKTGLTFEPIYGLNSFIDLNIPGQFTLSASLSFKYDW